MPNLSNFKQIYPPPPFPLFLISATCMGMSFEALWVDPSEPHQYISTHLYLCCFVKDKIRLPI